MNISEAQIVAAIEHWYHLAKREAEARDHAVAAGYGHPSSYNARIRTYEETARAMRLGLETGRVWCSCCLSDTSHHGQSPILGGKRSK